MDINSSYSYSYFVGTDGQYAGAIMDDAGNGIDESDFQAEIPQRPLRTLIIDDIERDGSNVWGRSNGQLFELFKRSEDENELETIRNGYREVFCRNGYPAIFEGELLYCQASDIEDEI